MANGLIDPLVDENGIALEPTDEQIASKTVPPALRAPSGGQAARTGCVSALTKSSSWLVVQHSNAWQCCSYVAITESP